MNRIILLLLSLLLLAGSCSKSPQKVVKAYYQWQQSSSVSTSKLDSLDIHKVYYKLFEVNYQTSMGNFPYDKSYVYGSDFAPSSIVIPTVFVRNEIFKHNTLESLDSLADNISFLIDKMSKDRWDGEKIFDYTEIQIDCDWTPSTKEKYFYLLKKIKEHSKKQISCTLRLYPYAYPDKMGVPPVDRAMLMCYNLISPIADAKKNSVLDTDELEKYLKDKKQYPLPLDIALPVFSWSIFYHNQHFSQLSGISEADFTDFTKKIDSMWYEVTEDHSLGTTTYVKVGDRIKVEKVSPQQITKALELIKKYVLLEDTVTVSLFDFRENTFKRYSDEEITSFYNHLLAR